MQVDKKGWPISYVVFSVYRPVDEAWLAGRKAKHNTDDHAEMRRHLALFDIQYVEVDGKYNGIEEKSFLVSAEHLDKVRGWAKQNNQETILLLGKTTRSSDYVGKLENLTTGEQEYIGLVVPVSEEVALQEANYSYFRGDINQHYIAKQV